MIEQLQNKIREWATRCSDLIRENEALLRANEGVKTLESIISKINEEKQHLYHEVFFRRIWLILMWYFCKII